MKTYVFNAYFLNGNGQIIHLVNFDFQNEDYYFPSQRKLLPLGYVHCDFDNPKFGYYPIEVEALNLKDALSILANFAYLNRLNLVLQKKYICHSFGRTSNRTLRTVKSSV